MNTDFQQHFRDLPVFVTGHTGFKGSWLCLWLQRLGARVTGYGLDPPTEPNNFTVASVAQGLARDHRVDIREGAALEAALDEARPEVVLHLAAQSTVRESYRAPRETFAVNVMGTANLLDALRRLRRPCAVVLVSSDKCYDNREQVWGYRETDPLGGHDPYSASKGAMELLAASYRDSYFAPRRLAEHGVQLATARAGNVLGGGDWTRDALLVDAIDALWRGQPVGLRNPLAVRPWQHVLEPLSGYLQLASRMLRDKEPRLSGGWNFGPLAGQEVPVWQLVEQATRCWGGGSWENQGGAGQPAEAGQLRLSIDKALWQLGWRPRWDLRQALEHTVHWYREYFAGVTGMRQLCLDQIALYESTPGLGDVQHDTRPCFAADAAAKV